MTHLGRTRGSIEGAVFEEVVVVAATAVEATNANAVAMTPRLAALQFSLIAELPIVPVDAINARRCLGQEVRHTAIALVGVVVGRVRTLRIDEEARDVVLDPAVVATPQERAIAIGSKRQRC